MMINDDVEETARLALMDGRGHLPSDFFTAIREVHPDVTLLDVRLLSTKYRGGNGTPPTHDFETGEMRR